MATPTTVAPVVTNPGGTGTTITPTLPSGHAAGDVIEIFIGNSGVTTWSAPAGWTIKQQTASSGNASSGVVGTILFRRVLSGDTLPLASPVCSLGATVTRGAIAFVKRGADVEGVHTLFEWLAFGSATANSNPIRPPSVTTRSPENLITHYYVQRSATNTPEPTGYTQVQQIVVGTIAINVAEKNVADQNTVLSNQDASPTSGVRWVGMISCTPSPDYPYYRSGSQAFNANGTSVTPALPTGTTASDNRGNKDLIVLTAQCAGADPTLNTPGDWTPLPDWSNTTSGGATTVRKWWRLYNGSGDRQVNRTPSGEIFAYLSVYHNAHQSIATGTSAVQQNASSTTSTFPALPRTGTKATVQATCVADATPTFTAPSGWTERNDSQGVTCADQSFDATGTTASDSFTLSSASPTLAGLMEVFSVASVINLILTPATATLTLTSFAPAVVVGVDVTVTPDIASLTLTTFTPFIIVGLPFPATAQLDDFNRADGALGDNWGGNLFDADGTLTIDANAVRGASPTVNNNQGWIGQFGPDCEVWVQILSGTSSDFSTFIAARWSVLGTDTPDGYAVRARGGDTNNLFLMRFDNGALTGLAVITQEVDDGDWLGLRVVGDRLDVYFKDASGLNQWQWVGGATDGTYSAAGHIGLLLTSDTIKSDNFGGGTLGSVTIEPAPAALTLTGFAPLLQLATTPTTVSLTLSTFAPTVTVAVTVTPTTVTFSLTTFAPIVTTTANVSVTPAPATLSLTTFAVALQLAVTPDAQLFALSTFAPTLATTVIPTNTNLLLSTFAPAVTTNTILTPASASPALVTFAPQLREVVTVNAASLLLTTFAPTVTTTANLTVTPDAATLTVTRFAPSLHERLTPGAVILSLTTFAPEITISADIAVTPASQVLALTQFAPSLQLVVTPTASTLSLSTFAPTITISADRVETPASALLILTTFAPELRLVVTPTTAVLSLSTNAPVLGLVVQPANASLVLSTFAPSLTVDIVVTPTQASLTVTTFAPAVTTGALVTTVTPAPATLILTGYAPWLFTGLVPANRTYMVESGVYEVVISTGDYELVED